MTPGRRGALGFAAVIVLAAVAFASFLRPGATPATRPAKDRPTLLLLTSLPLVFGEGFSLEGGGSPALKALQSRYRVLPISVSDRAELAKGRLLLMAQPRAQRPDDLVALDNWVRSGGRVLLLADPMLEWPSERPLGDPLRPPSMFQDTGLLRHWGLRLDAPDERGPRTESLGGHEIQTASPGELIGVCAVGQRGLIARCRIGKGRATIVADADLLDVEHLDGPTEHNLEAVLAELGRLEQT